MKFLIAGFGSIGRRHFRNLLALGEKDIVLLRSGRSTLDEAEIAGFRVETDLQAALDLHPDVVVVANPTAKHLDTAIPAARAGCHLLLEKPISHSLERVDELKQAAAQGGGKVLVGFQYRFHEGLLQVRRLLEAGTVGRPVAVHAHYGEYLPGWHPWEDYRKSYSARSELGGGVTLTLSHPLDYLRWLFGEVESVWAFVDRRSGLELDVDDTAEIGLRFSSGLAGSVHLDYIQRPTTRSLEIVGTEGTLRWDDVDGTARLFQASKAGEWEIYAPPAGYDRNDMFLAEMRHMIAAACGEAEPACSLEDGIQALKMSLAAVQSSERGEKVLL